MTTPTISGVSGTVSAGQTLTITGTSMVDEDTTSWLSWCTANAVGFEGTSPESDGYIAGGGVNGTYVTDVKLMGSQSVRFHCQGASSNCPVGNLEDYLFSPDLNGGADTADVWIRFYARWKLNAGNWPSSHIKCIDSQGYVANFQMYFQPGTTGTSQLPDQFIAQHDGVSNGVDIPSGRLQNERWYGIELHWKNIGGNLFLAYMDGVEVYNEVPTNTVDLAFLPFGFINLCGTDSAFDLDHWWDGFAVSSSRVRLASIVEIGNSSDYATATKVYQAPTTLSNTSNVVTCDLTGLGAGPYWMWVTNNKNERSSAFSLSGVSAALLSRMHSEVMTGRAAL